MGAKVGDFNEKTYFWKYVDDAHDRVYLLPWQFDKILVYDTNGSYLFPINLPVLPNSEGDSSRIRVTKAVFQVSPDAKTLAVVQLPFESTPYVAWTQTSDGKLIKAVPSGYFAGKEFNEQGQRVGYSNEIITRKNSSSLDFFLTTGADSIYHFDMQASKLYPVFTMNYPQENKPIHLYFELARHFFGWFNENDNYKSFIFDKNDLRGGFFQIENDYLGNIGVNPYSAFSNGYFGINRDLGDLLEDLEKALKKNNMSDAMRAKLTKLKDGIGEKDNNYIFYAKIKQWLKM